MPSTVTLADLRTRVRAIVAAENSGWPDALDLHINQAWKDLYARIVGASWGEQYFLKESNVAVVGGTKAYNLPDDFYKSLGVDWQETSTERRALEALVWRERESYTGTAELNADTRYLILEATIAFYPTPSSSGTVVLSYIKAPPKLVDSPAGGANEASSIDDVCGWSEYVVLRAAAKIKLSENDPDTATAVAMADQELARIISDAPIRDGGASPRVANTRRQPSWRAAIQRY